MVFDTVLSSFHDFIFTDDIEEKSMVKNPYLPLSIVAFYVVFVKWIGPALMKNYKPFDLKYAMITYNFMQCILNAYVTCQLFWFLYINFKLRCMVKNNPDLPKVLEQIKLCGWHLYLIKFTDLIDTVFFVLRKKYGHVSFLHVFHHSFMCVLYFAFLTSMNSVGYYLGLSLAINTSVHVVMYFYYALAAFGPEMRPYLWWKVYLTRIQIAQFLIILSYMLVGFLTGCEDFGFMEISVFSYVLVICILFINFYRKYKQN